MNDRNAYINDNERKPIFVYPRKEPAEEPEDKSLINNIILTIYFISIS